MGGGLREASICRYRCGVRKSPSTEVWTCVADFLPEDEPSAGGGMAPMGGRPRHSGLILHSAVRRSAVFSGRWYDHLGA